MNKKNMLWGVAFAAMVMASGSVYAETVTTTTYVGDRHVPNVNEVNFQAFDMDRDGSFSMTEVGDKLFQLFDTNSDKMIDNIEWDKKTVFTIIPMEKQVFKYVDLNNDGRAEASTYTYEAFYKDSGLIKFDENRDGLSAKEFIGVGFLNLDDNDDKMITKDEWKEAYLKIVPQHGQNDNYN